ncbi:MAG: hypothetical protein UMU04_01850 [Halanaerobiales bacterium]|nr:hypothetical protein [Halanaerobiales bacterium]
MASFRTNDGVEINYEVEDVTAVGWSMGAAVLWSYLELFGEHTNLD